MNKTNNNEFAFLGFKVSIIISFICFLILFFNELSFLFSCFISFLLCLVSCMFLGFAGWIYDREIESDIFWQEQDEFWKEYENLKKGTK